MSDTILDDDQFGSSAGRRRELLPFWIKFFLWIFMVFGAIVPLAFIAGLSGISFHISLYGLETSHPMSVLGFLVTVLFGFKGVVAYGLWTEKDWAVEMAIIDAGIGIATCLFVMFALPFVGDGGFSLNLRFELIALIPYLLKMREIKPEWERRRELF